MSSMCRKHDSTKKQRPALSERYCTSYFSSTCALAAKRSTERSTEKYPTRTLVNRGPRARKLGRSPSNQYLIPYSTFRNRKMIWFAYPENQILVTFPGPLSGRCCQSAVVGRYRRSEMIYLGLMIGCLRGLYCVITLSRHQSIE